MDPSVIARHIALYVNDYTVALDERAVRTFLSWVQEHDGGPESGFPIFV
jgi:predicted solute-binding protein